MAQFKLVTVDYNGVRSRAGEGSTWVGVTLVKDGGRWEGGREGRAV